MEKFQWTRRVTSPVKVGDVTIGGNNPVVVRSEEHTSELQTQR